MPSATGTFEIQSWNEEPYDDLGGDRRLTRAEVAQRFTGDLDGDGAVVWLMCYRPDGTADWLGLQKVTGSVAGRRGSFVLRTIGTFDGAKAAGDWEVIPGSADGQLDGLSGRGRIEAPMGSEATYTLEYDLA